MIRHLLFSLIALACVALPARAGIDDLPITTVDGRSYHYYDVEPKQTIYSLCRELGISKQQLIEANPSIAENGLQAYQRLLFPVAADAPKADDTTPTSAEPTSAKTYIAKDHETIYAISMRFGITPSQLEAWNPGIRNGIHKGDRLFVSDPGASQPAAAAAMVEAPIVNSTAGSNPDYREYVVKERETFYSIAHTNGVSVGDLEAANPDVSLLRPGMTLRIPLKPGAEAKAEHSERLEPQPDPAYVVITNDDAKPAQIPPLEVPVQAVAAPDEESVTIALLLPFMLNETERSKRADLMTEFYKGFLLAVDSLRNGPRPIKIMTFDTEGSDARLREILNDPSLTEAQVIIAPDNATQLDLLGRYGADHNIDILNLFVVADQSYATTPYLFQATIPHDAMYTMATDAMLRHFSDGFTPVILSPTDVKPDKEKFINGLTAALRKNGIDYTTIEYSGMLTEEHLADLDRDGRYAFIPTTARQADLNRMMPALIELKGNMTAYDPLRLYGYPEWITFRGETLTNMHTLNTYLYSRFFTSPEDPWARRVEEAYQRWYGDEMAATVPRQGLLGFDTGMFLIGALSSGTGIAGAPVYHGVQNAFRFIRPAGVAGYVNDDLYFVNFRPSGLTDRISL